MRFSDKGLKLLADWEGCILYPYDDADKGAVKKKLTEWNKRATIGIGHLIKNEEEFELFRNGITREQADELCFNDLKDSQRVVMDLVDVPINKQCEFDALCIFVFNIGYGQFLTSSALKMINNQDVKTIYVDLESAWKAFNKAKDKETGKLVVSQGLINRRQKEWDLYSGKYD